LLLRPMLKLAKRTLLKAAQRTGVFAVVSRSRWRTNRLLILGYHGVALEDEHQWDPALYLSPEQFRARMEWLARGGGAVLPLGEALDRLYQGTLPPRSVALTFDDGFHDFYAVAHPILRQLGLPATVYLTSFYCTTPLPVFDPACAYILWKGRGQTIDGAGLAADGKPLALASAAGRQDAWQRIQRFAAQSGAGAEGKRRLLEALAARLGVDYAALCQRRLLHIMTPEEVRRVHTQGVDVQLHTHRHRVPRQLELFQREILDNRAALQHLLPGAPPATHFCYPSGECAPEFLPWLRELGVVSAVTCQPGLASRASDPLRLPRLIDVGGLAPIELEGWLSGVSHWQPVSPA